jgi:hypothetical protein
MKVHYPKYDQKRAPAILMRVGSHIKTYGVFNSWRAERRRQAGGKFDWKRISEAEMKNLSEKLFDAAKVPLHIRSEYWNWYSRMIRAIGPANPNRKKL